jgi:catalase
MIKYCYKCKENKPVESFGKNKSKKDGLSTECRPCKRIGDKQYYQANADQIKQTVAKYRAENPDKVSQVKHEWYERHQKHVYTKAQSWRKSNLDSYYQSQRKYNSLNKGKRNALLAKYRATKLQATPPWFEKDLVETVYMKAKEWGFAVDHIVPLQGDNVCGLHCWANLQLLDPLLNSSKGNRFQL